MYGPRQLAPREVSIVRRIRDGCPFIVLPDGGLTLVTFGYTENLAHAVLLAVDNDAARGEAFSGGDEGSRWTLRQVAELVSDELGHHGHRPCRPKLAVPARPADDGRPPPPVMDLSKAKTLLEDTRRGRLRRAALFAPTARWLFDNPPDPGGIEEKVLEDPFDYATEDALVASWRAAVGSVDVPTFVVGSPPGLAYGGPGTNYTWPDTRI